MTRVARTLYRIRGLVALMIVPALIIFAVVYWYAVLLVGLVVLGVVLLLGYVARLLWRLGRPKDRAIQLVVLLGTQETAGTAAWWDDEDGADWEPEARFHWHKRDPLG